MTSWTVTDGGLETDLIYQHGIDLPEFAAFPLLEHPEGRAVLRNYYAEYAAIARDADAPLLLEGATWRANPDWGAALGYDAAALDRINRAAIAFLRELGDEFGIADTKIGGTIGPRGDGYRPGAGIDPGEAETYHRPQLAAFAAAGADLATAYTLTDPGEAIGIVRAARAVGVPIAISFTVETDGLVPNGSTLAAAITAVDAAEPPAYFVVNCAHPDHIARALNEPGGWRDRVRGLRPNASRKSHAELDEAADLDDGDPADFARAVAALASHFPNVEIAGGCCGTDARHVAALFGAGN